MRLVHVSTDQKSKIGTRNWSDSPPKAHRKGPISSLQALHLKDSPVSQNSTSSCGPRVQAPETFRDISDSKNIRPQDLTSLQLRAKVNFLIKKIRVNVNGLSVKSIAWEDKT